MIIATRLAQPVQNRRMIDGTLAMAGMETEMSDSRSQSIQAARWSAK
jgi:hypothetical protein